MSGEGQAATINRIERALARIEAVAARVKSSDGDPALARRHAELRERVEAAIASLDTLIAEPDDD